MNDQPGVESEHAETCACHGGVRPHLEHRSGLFELAPFGVGTEFDRVIAGTGKYRGASGLFHFNFVGNADLSELTSSVIGELQTGTRGD